MLGSAPGAFMTKYQATWDNIMIIPFIKRAPTLESLRQHATDGITAWLTGFAP
jgi:hypothetical protein